MLSGYHQFDVVGLVPGVLIVAAAFFLGLEVAVLGAAVGLGTDFLGLAVFLMAVSLSCLCAFFTS